MKRKAVSFGKADCGGGMGQKWTSLCQHSTHSVSDADLILLGLDEGTAEIHTEANCRL